VTTEPGTERAAEYVVLCGADHERIGYAPKAEVHHARTPLHLAFSCYVFDPAGRLLVTRRAWHKRTWPGVRTNSCCGHPGPDEPVAGAVRRRLDQELGIAVDRVDLVLPEFRYHARMDDGVEENEVCPVFRAVVPEGAEPHRDPDEVAETGWMPWQDFVGEVDADPAAVSPWAALQVGELRQLGPDPLGWAAADEGRLPPAARETLEAR